jgi:hypothetical protein
MTPSEAIHRPRSGCRCKKANDNVNNAADAEQPPRLHHEGNAPTVRDDLLRAENRKIEDERNHTQTKTREQRIQRRFFSASPPEHAPEKYDGDRRRQVCGNGVDSLENAGIASCLR